jgi:amino acid adenylation domain-containing protein
MTAPRDSLQTAIAKMWADVLGLEDVPVDADFFELGGDSLAAVRMLAALEDEFLVPVNFVDFLDGPTVAALAAVLEIAGARELEPELPAAPAASPAPAAPAPEVATGHALLSFAQERLWFLDQLGGSTEAYNMPIGTRITGLLDAGALDRAFTELVARHQALRTTFAAEEGHPVQVVAATGAAALERVDLRGEADPAAAAQARVDELASAPLTLATGPLVRGLLLRIADDEHVLELVFHHIICDGWSHAVVFRELAALYAAYAGGEASALPPPRIQFPDAARSERARLDATAIDGLVAPWLERLAGAPDVLELPTDRPRPQVQTYRGATYRVRLSADTAAAVRRFARARRATPFATLLAVYYVLLARHSGQDDVIVGATTSGRDRPEFEDGIGLFASTVALRGDLSGDPSFATLVDRTREVVLWALAHQQAPFEQIVARLDGAPDLSRHPVFQVFCAQVPLIPPMLDGAKPFDARPSTSRFDLTLFVEEERDDLLKLAWEYSTDLFDAATIERLAARYLRLLDAALADPERAVGALPMLDAAEAAASQAAGEQPAAVPAGGYPVACMHELFARHAAASPEAPAVTFEGTTISYGALNTRANRLARRLRERGAGRETLVALFLEPSIEMIVAILAVLKAGAAYLPLDPEYPSDRIAFVLEDAAAPLVVATSSLASRLPETGAAIVTLDGSEGTLIAGLSGEDLEPVAAPENLAYVIYTSGSTGRPKGVLVEHRNVARLFSATDAWYGFGPSDVWVLLHSYAFDFSVWEIWGALASGGRLVISPLWTTRSPQGLAELVAGEKVTVLNATPSLFVTVQEELTRALPDDTALRCVVFGGEALAPAALTPWYDRFGEAAPTLVNMYGITETTVHVTYRPLTAADCAAESSPIGVPIPDLSLHLLDPHGTPVPVGVAGELYVGGAGVARGYLNRPELTAERFIDNPFGEGRLYRTGDVARRLPDGELDFRGRIDDQVKIRGFRIELGEVQGAVREVPGVAETAVLAVDAAPGDTRLVAYVVPSGSAAGPGDGATLRAAILDHLGERLPAYMVPASIMTLERLPLTRNGKTDRKALPAPVWETETVSDSRVPETETELAVAEIWKSVLSVDSVGADDNFFNLGGHSLLAARVVTQTRKRCEVELSVRALFDHPALAAFAGQVDSAKTPVAASEEPAGAPADAAEPSAAAPADGAPLSYPQQQLALFDAVDPGNVTYNAALAVRVRGPFDPEALRGAVAQVLARHEVLRTVVEWEEAVPRQVVLAEPEVPFEVVDCAGASVDAVQERLQALARRPFDLAHDVILRTVVLTLGPDEHVVLFQTHHIAFDAWAVEILYRELGEAYAATREGRAAQLPELARQYRDFAIYQRERLSGSLLERELDFWRAQLAGAPTILRLPTDRRRPAEPTFVGATFFRRLDRPLTEAIRELCTTSGTSPYMLLMAAFATLLYRRSGEDDILLGGPMANRDHAGFENLIGFFANTTVVRTRMAGNPTFLELLATVRDSVLASYEHQEVPLELVVDAINPRRDPGVNPLFQVNFRVRVGEPPVLRLPAAETSLVRVDQGLARFDLALELHVADHGVEAEFNYNTALWDNATVQRLADDLEALLRQVVAGPEQRLLGFTLSEAPAAAAPQRSAGIRGFRREAAQ